jgi:hypothetical protein
MWICRQCCAPSHAICKKAFISCEVPDQPTARDAMQTIIEIVKAHPGSNQSQIVARLSKQPLASTRSRIA